MDPLSLGRLGVPKKKKKKEGGKSKNKKMAGNLNHVVTKTP